MKRFPVDFNAEHVIPELFGLFGVETLTLNDLVCKKCNQYFGDELELYLGRDSVFGLLYRSIAGVVKPRAFKKSIRHKRKRVVSSIKHADHDHLLVDIELNANKNFDVIIANQVIVMNSTKGNRLHFRVDQLSHRRELEDIGLKPLEGYVNFFSRANNIPLQVQEFNAVLEQAGISIRVAENQFGQFKFPDKEGPLYFKSVVDENIQRALAKIVFNYFAYQYPRETVLSDCFNEIISFIRYGLKANRYLMAMDNKSIVTGEQEIQEAKYARHIITISQDGENNIVGQMSLFNNIRFEVVLSRCYPLIGFPLKGSLFDIVGKKVIDIRRFM